MIATGLEYDELFNVATRIPGGPYQYQVNLATGLTLPQLVDIPTGCGKTAAVVLGWLWKRRFGDEAMKKGTPRRLVYCLPMRVVVEQTRDNVINWLDRLGMLAGEVVRAPDGKIIDYKPLEGHRSPQDDTRLPDGFSAEYGSSDSRIAVTILMGGEDKDEWDRYPERDAIIIGTQDMLLSRALNRGYGMSKYRWPVHFGLLNNDCLWVMDEVQLMGVGVETSAQMQAFREMFGSQGNVITLWMSATLGEEQLDTVDHIKPDAGWSSLSMGENLIPKLEERYKAKKELKKATFTLNKENVKTSYAEDMANLVIVSHNTGTLSLVIVNNVGRAQAIFQKLLKKGRTEEDTAVLHSRFRENDRASRMEILEKPGDRIIVATQVVEAGVDISAHTLITELAPWPSLVQRFGRCNRYGDFNDSHIEWIDMELEEKDDIALPYDASMLDEARSRLIETENAGPMSLASEEYKSPSIVRPVIRRKDILDLFDTTSDLSGNDLDISRYIRDGVDNDVQVYWRDIHEDGPSGRLPKVKRNELCNVSIGDINNFLKKEKGWIWDPLDSRWISVGKGGEENRCRPRQTVLLRKETGGYTSILGWVVKGKKTSPVEPVPLEKIDNDPEEAMEDDPGTHIGRWVTITDHCNDVSTEVERLAIKLGFSDDRCEALRIAGLWHDVGKVHDAFQNMLLYGREDCDSLLNDGPWAKSDKMNQRSKYRAKGEDGVEYHRKYFRHELASTLSWLQNDGADHPSRDLIAYLICSHHGKVRQSIRSLPDEKEPPREGVLFARGIWDGDRLQPVPGIVETETKLDLSLMEMGEGSWLERTLRLREQYGPFQLAFLETILRVVDWKVSARAEEVSQ